MTAKEFFSHRQHPIKILSYTTRNFWLILIPLARDFFSARYSLAGWLYGSWLSILTILAIFGYALLRWASLTYYFSDDCITAKSGYFGILETKIFYSKISSISARQSPLYALFRASTVCICTSGKGRGITLTLRKSETDRIFSLAGSVTTPKSVFSFRPKALHVLLFSLLFSSSLSGLAIICTFLIEWSKILGNDLAGTIPELVTKRETLYARLPLVIASVLSAGWLLSFIANLMRHGRFSIARSGDKLLIQSGIITKRRHILSRSSIVFTDVSQNLIMKLFRICSVRVGCNGYGRRNYELGVIIPLASKSELKSSERLLLPEIPLPPKISVFTKRSIFSYVALPVCIAAAIPIIAWLAFVMLPHYRGTIKLCTAIALIPALWFCIVRLVASQTSGIGCDGRLVRLDYCRGFSFHSVSVEKNSIAKVGVRRSVFQLRSGKCGISVRVCYPRRSRHKISAIGYDEALTIFGITGGIL